MLECVIITKTDGSLLYSAHYGENQSLSSVQETEATVYRLTNQNWNVAKGRNYDVSQADGKLIVFTNVEDLLFFAVKSNKNDDEDDEVSMMELLEGIVDGLGALCTKRGLSYAALQEQYPQVCLTVSEYIREGVTDQIDGIIVEELVQFKSEKSKK